MFEYAVDNTIDLSEADIEILKRVWKNRTLRMLISDFNYTGEYPRASRKLGFECKLSDANGKRKNKNTKATKWQFTKRAQGKCLPAETPSS
jgi:hypothetical protein